MIAATAIASIGAFVAALRWLGVVRLAADAVRTSRRAAEALNDSRLDDRARETAARRAALQLAAGFASIVFRLGLAVVASLAPIGLANASGLASARHVLAFLAGWPAAVIATGMAAVAYAVRVPRWPTS